MGKDVDERLAYHVSDGDNGALVFASKSVVARRIGAGELGISFNQVESCQRAPKFDQYASLGHVPARVALEEPGWWFQCGSCGIAVNRNGAQDGSSSAPVYDQANDERVFCSDACHTAFAEHWGQIAALRTEVEAEANKRWPGVTVKQAWVDYSMRAHVQFNFPGSGEGLVGWTLGETTALVGAHLIKAWADFIGRLKTEAPCLPSIT